MSNRIPPKGTEGYSRYWADRHLAERLQQEAEYVQGFINARMLGSSPKQPGPLWQVLWHKAEAARIAHEVWKVTDYFAFNTQKGTST